MWNGYLDGRRASDSVRVAPTARTTPITPPRGCGVIGAV
jgi:hypothetical protein